jgi:hypothetical protein
MSRVGVASFALALKLAVLWWLALTVGSLVVAVIFSIPGTLLPGNIGDDIAMALPFFGGLFIFPVIALVIGVLFAHRQQAAVGGRGAAALFGIGCERTLHVELPDEQLLKLLESAMTSTLRGVALDRHPWGFVARLTLPASATAWWPALHEDRLVASVSANGANASVLTLRCAPRHEWLYGTLLVDRGRGERNLANLVDAIEGRLRAQSAMLEAMRQRDAGRARQSEAELATLRAQVEPHFLFNTLAHIQASLRPSPAVAEAMLEALIAFLRSNSQAFSHADSRLDDELRMVGHYLALIGLRLGDRLQYELHCPPSLAAQRVPSAAVLVLVENAEKHGIERRPEGGIIAVHCEQEGDRVTIRCENEGPQFQNSGNGSGLANLQSRLRLMHGAHAGLEIENLPNGRVSVALTLPAMESPAE